MASAETATGSSPSARSRSARAMATSVLPTPVGPKIAITRTARSIVRRGSVHIATGLSTTPDARAGALEAASAAARALNGRPCDLAVLFASGAHLAEPEGTLAALHEVPAPPTLGGRGAAGGGGGGGRGGGPRAGGGGGRGRRCRSGRPRWARARCSRS